MIKEIQTGVFEIKTEKSRHTIYQSEHPQMVEDFTNDAEKLANFESLLDEDALTAYNIYNNIPIEIIQEQ